MEEGEERAACILQREKKDMIGLREMKQVKHEDYKETEIPFPPLGGVQSVTVPQFRKH